MVKVNIDENPQIAQQMRIQSIPAVYAFKEGRPVDGFVGALPESQVKQFVQRLGGGKGGPSPIEEALAMAKQALQEGDHATAGTLYAQVLQREPAHVEALAGNARALIARGDLAKARQTLDRVPKESATSRSAPRAQRSNLQSRRKRRWPEPANCAPAWRRTPTITRRGSNSPPVSSAAASARRRSTSC
jgi:putative thioredoxin